MDRVVCAWLALGLFALSFVGYAVGHPEVSDILRDGGLFLWITATAGFLCEEMRRG